MATHPDVSSILFTQPQLQIKIEELGKTITKDYSGKSLVCICILKGAFMFFSELIKHIDLPIQIEFMALSSYGNASQSSGNVEILLDLRHDIKDKHILIVDDIIDSGLTITFLKDFMKYRHPASLSICSLLRVKSEVQLDAQIKYIGFEIPKNTFVVGFGLDYAEKYRTLPYIGILKEELYK